MSDLFIFKTPSLEDKLGGDSKFILEFSDRETETDAYYKIVEHFRPIIKQLVSEIDYKCLYNPICELGKDLKYKFLQVESEIQLALEKNNIHIKTYIDVLLEITENEILVSLLTK